ncbi:MAG TPA: Rieske 2Fe-2S domain-containing protein [Mycobacteriales bacterium]|jgi:thiosulfate dehydrogenase [quinone] large subunit
MAIGADDDHVQVRPLDGRLRRWRARTTDPTWLLLPQRLFLGFTFAYAGLDKLADRSFFDPAAPTSIHAQLAAVRDTSPLGPLLRALSGHAGTLGVLIALGEIAVGVATLLGVRVRLAAAGGALISLSLLLTVTWATRPYYYGSDVVFLVCWLPLVLFGAGGVLSLEVVLARRFPAGGEPRPDRRALLAQAAVVAVTAGLAGAAALLARGTRSPVVPAAVPTPGGANPGGANPGGANPGGANPGGANPGASGARLAAVTDVPVGGAVAVTLPGSGTPALLARPTADTVVGFQRACTHAGCAVEIAPDGRTFRCPCHGAVYDAGTGAVLAGPAPSPLPAVPVRVVGPDVLAGG